MKGIQNFSNLPFFVSMATAAKFVQPIPICLAYLVPLDVDVVPIKFHQFLFWRVTCYDLFCVYHFFSIWPFPWQRQPFWKNQPLKAQLHMAYVIPTGFHKV
jgi:hypothetical protein